MYRQKRSTTVFTMLIVITAMITSCTFPFTNTTPEPEGWLDWDEEDNLSESIDASSSGFLDGVLDSIGGLTASKSAGEASDTVHMEEAPAAAPVTGAEMPVSPATSDEERSTTNQNSYLRAGSVDDNQQWDDYLLYRLQFADWGYEVHDVDVTERHTFAIRNDAGNPVLAALIEVEDERGNNLATLRTHSDGRATFFPAIHADEQDQLFQVTVSKDGDSQDYEISRSDRLHELVLDTSSSTDQLHLDIHFLIDVTGSMADEIQQLKDNMIAISQKISLLPENPAVRFGMTIYRDRGDSFVSRTHDFTSDVETFTAELERVQADGGGDYPESLNEGLHKSLYLPEWRIEDTISLIFLVADAPPHLDYPQDNDYAEDVFFAAESGIKIFPIASSGLDDQGEYILRQLAQISGGKFLFLTYGAGGAAGDDTSHHVDDYSVLSLDEMVIRIVSEELAALQPEIQ